MGCLICANALMQCSFGIAPAPFIPNHCATILGKGMIGNISDATPANITPFGMCNSMANPTVMSATTAALGVLTPMPCIPMPCGLWIPAKPTILACQMPILTSDAILMCAYGGSIQFINSPTMNIII